MSIGLLNKSLETDEVVEESIAFVRENLSDKGEIFVGFSGGKDSITVEKIMSLSGVPYKLYHSFSGIDPPEVIRFIRKHYPECEFLHPVQSFWRKLSVSIPPSGHVRWCCEILRKLPSWGLPHKHRVFGIRWEESSRRASYPRINYKAKIDHYEYYPIAGWNTYHVWDFIHRNKMPYPVLYDQGFDRVGCCICPFHSEKTGMYHKMYRDRYPKHFEKFERTIKELYYKRVEQGKKMFYPTPEAFLEAWYKDDCARWYDREEDNKETVKKGLVI